MQTQDTKNYGGKKSWNKSDPIEHASFGKKIIGSFFMITAVTHFWDLFNNCPPPPPLVPSRESPPLLCYTLPQY